MDFNLSREHQLIRKMMAEFTEKEVKPIAAETDRTCEYPRENIEKLFDLGVMGMCVPKEYGGAGADPSGQRHLHRGAVQAVRLHRRHRGHPQRPVLRSHHDLRHRRAEGQVPAHADHRPPCGRLRPDGAQRRLRRLQGPDRGQTGGRPLCDERLQDLHHQRLCGRCVRGVRHDRQVHAAPRASPPSSWRAASPASPWASTRKSWASTAVPTAEIVFQDCIVPKENLLGVEGKGFSIAMADAGRRPYRHCRPVPGHRRGRAGRRPSTTPRAVSSSASPSASSRTPSSRWPTWSWAARRAAC